MKRLAFLFGFAFLTQFGIARADTRYALLWCNNCTSAQMSAKATSGGAGLGIIYIADVVTRNVMAFNATKEVIGYDEYGNAIFGPKQVVQVATSPTYVDVTNKLMDFYYTSPLGWIKTYARAGSGATSVYDVVNRGTRQTGFLSDRRADAAFLPVFMTELGARVASAFKLTDGSQYPRVLFTYTFPDGSTIQIEYDLASDKLKIVDESGIDKFGNPVLSAPSDRPVVFDLTDNDSATLANWANQMRMLGYTGASATKGVYACVKAGNTYYCYVMNQ